MELAELFDPPVEFHASHDRFIAAAHACTGQEVDPQASLALIPDFLFVDFAAGLVDHDHASIAAAVIKVDGDLKRDQVGGFPCVVFAFAIQSNRVFEPDAIGNIKMKNGHGTPPRRAMPPSEVCSGNKAA
jgi:hypothetical protein